MTNNQDESLVDLKGVSKSIKNVSTEDQEAAQQAYDEFHALTLGKSEMNMTELHELRRHAKKRTNLHKPDDQLTPDQVIWKAIYHSIDKLMAEKLKPEDKENVDNLENQMDSLTDLADLTARIVPLGQEIERELTLEQAALVVYFDKSPQNEYKAVVDGVTTDLVNPDKWTPAERVEKAQTVLKIIDAQREYLYKGQLAERHEKIHRKLNDFEDIYRNLESITKNNENVLKEKGVSVLIENTRNWLRLTKKLLASRTQAISAVKNSTEADEFLPKYVLERKGDVGGTVSTSNKMFEQMAAYVVLINKANDEENELAKTRNPISEELFGKQESYMNFPQENTPNDKKVSDTPKNKGMSGKTKWTIVIILTIVALSWGIWTAIGVFILGSIIVGLLSSK